MNIDDFVRGDNLIFWLCARIEELEKILKNAEVVVEDEINLDKINVGCTVTVYDVEFEEEMIFKIVGSTEANSLQGKISNESPVGKALIGREVGDSVVTTSGFYGVVIDITDEDVIVEFGSNKNCRIPMKKAAISEVEKADAE